ncbi:TAXI family TRAP transporter solute-binding subunit [Nocardia testacea]|uniref:TAXI family TRAP transporter solute-binding subunit n=1 Tax=Nocardia testacea TaxID=248551 RepID=UPI003C2C2FC2
MFGSAARETMIGRRRALGMAALALTVAACGPPAPAHVRLGSGLAGGLFHEFGSTLAEAADRTTTVRVDPVPTAGSVENLELLESGGVDAALALGDSAALLGSRALAVGRLYESYIHLAVRADSPVQHIGDLRGARVDIGVAGSGAALTGERLLRSAGMEPGRDYTISQRELADALPALHSLAVDAILWGAGLPTPEVGTTASIRMLDLGEWVQPMRDRFGYSYDHVPVPANTYPGSSGFETIGVPVLLLVAPGTGDGTVVALADLLVHHSHALVPERARGFQFFDRRWLVSTGSIPLHPAAADYYRDQHG